MEIQPVLFARANIKETSDGKHPVVVPQNIPTANGHIQETNEDLSSVAKLVRISIAKLHPQTS
jgi:hypothetical protein